MARKKTRIRVDDLGKNARGEPTERDLQRVRGGSSFYINIGDIEGECSVEGHYAPRHVALLAAPPIEGPVAQSSGR